MATRKFGDVVQDIDNEVVVVIVAHGIEADAGYPSWKDDVVTLTRHGEPVPAFTVRKRNVTNWKLLK